jgi:hypothetical protein
VRLLVEGLERSRWRSEIRVAGPEVDDVDASRDELAFLLRDQRERILGKRLKSSSQLRH